MGFEEQLERVEARFEEINRLLADPAVAADYTRMSKLAQERSGLEEVVSTYRHYREVRRQLEETRQLLQETEDPEMRELAEMELEELQGQEAQLTQELRRLLLPKDPNDERDVILEIRAGTGGDEAALFAAELLRMYTRWAERHGYQTELLHVHETGLGGIKEAVLEVRGKGAYSQLKYESGVHRVQRVPATESQGRIHTSTATVAVLPEVEEVEVQIDPNDIRVDVFRSSGPGGQSVNTTDSAVRITHLPTGLVVTCQDEKSQLQNRQKALRILRSKLYEQEMRRQREELGAARRSQIGTGERSEKIRTYNFPQNRVTDHRIHRTVHRLAEVLDGDLDEFIQELAARDQAERLQAMAEAA